jgi:hypothetical protein
MNSKSISSRGCGYLTTYLTTSVMTGGDGALHELEDYLQRLHVREMFDHVSDDQISDD